MQMKRCGKCGLTKRLDEFHKNGARSDGHQSQCKVCKRAGNDAYFKTPHGNAVRRKNNSAFSTEYNREHANGPKRQARLAVMRAIRRGNLPRAKDRICVHCDKQAAQHHHHLGYGPEHWLDVEPVCRKCHAILH